jgi:DNA-nicking Smr family endonuclease
MKREDGSTEDASDETVVVPITDEIDLHSFAPRDIPSVVDEYLEACRARGIFVVRLVHGRGKGVQRAVVRRLLASREDMLSFEDSPPAQGGWGGTIVRLRAQKRPR